MVRLRKLYSHIHISYMVRTLDRFFNFQLTRPLAWLSVFQQKIPNLECRGRSLPLVARLMKKFLRSYVLAYAPYPYGLNTVISMEVNVRNQMLCGLLMFALLAKCFKTPQILLDGSPLVTSFYPQVFGYPLRASHWWIENF